ncbi:MAG: glycosyltransferase family 4 protein [Bacteroidales bacterium]
MINKIIVVIGIGVLSFALTYLIRIWAIKNKIVSTPNSRSMHTEVTPHGGGLAIVFAWYLGIAVFYVFNWIDAELFWALLCGLFLAAISFADDIVEIKPYIRLIVQFIVAIVALYILGGLRKPITPGVDILSIPHLIYPMAIIGMVWFINLYNFMDGADGFASLEAIIVSIVIFMFTGSWETLLLASGVFGFLFWNWPKAKIFMGDVGSTQLGFILVILGIHYHNTLDFSIFNWLMISSPFWFDATYTLLRRWRNGERISEPHRKHIYQRFVQSGFSHKQLNYSLIIINIFIVVLILIYREFDFLKIPIYILTLIMLFVISIKVDRLFPFK